MARQSNTFTTLVEGKLVRTPKPLTKGMALIKARELLGPSADVGVDPALGFVIGMFTNAYTQISVGASWEQALERAAQHTEVARWHDYQITIGNEIARAKESLAKTMVDIAKKNYERLKNQFKVIRQGQSLKRVDHHD